MAARRWWRWQVHGDGKHLPPGEVVAPDERLSWPLTIGIGMQHVVAMFGATFLVPALTGFPASTTLFFSAIGTILFLIITAGRVPSYLGSSFAFIAPIGAATATGEMSSALGGIIAVGVMLVVVGVIVHVAGSRWIDIIMPPVVTGAIVALIGLNLAPAAWNNVQESGLTAAVTVTAILLCGVLFRGFLGRLSILLGVVIGYGFAAFRGEVELQAVEDAGWFGWPEFVAPTFDPNLLGLFLPVVLVLVAENVGHVKSVAAITRRDLDPVMGRALIGDGVATALAGAGGGSGTTTYAENIGVMAATRVYSTAAYVVAAVFAFLLSLSPKFGAVVATVPEGVLGGAGTVLYGMIGILGVRIWVQNRVDFSNTINLGTAGVALVLGIANYTWIAGEMSFEGIALGSAAAIGVYHVLRIVARLRGTADNPEKPLPVETSQGH
ncbi:uracil-xanthine permease family protein [Bogoriella caseilytica]|uniref:Uracil-xanthine permease n=1 Tax=Bogoriella caseilytica TaxID=56055 RepID=A0A3N2BBI4_9MICO|nr:solute carrier family 23 protein [Bogoriella caseilytica]ROR72621.1 uracil-xanthine permease [Bogoriella caseilytica]